MDLAELALVVDSRAVARSSDHLKEFGKQADRASGLAGKFSRSAATGFGAVKNSALGALGAVVGVSAAVKTIADFESSMSRLSAVSGSTTMELEAMRNIARELGSATEFSARQAADGLNFLAMAGFSASESMAAIPSVLDLATASGMGLAQAADTASNIMSGFGIAAERASSVSDVLAATASRANTSVSQLGGAMSTVAPISAALDIGLSDTAAAIGTLSDAGIQGERAGTALRGVLAALASPTSQADDALSDLNLTVRDVDPAANELSVVLGRLNAAGLSTADAMTIFGREAASGALVLVESAQRVGEFGEELSNAEGEAARMAGTIRDNLKGDLQAFVSGLQGLVIALGDAGLTQVLRLAAQSFTNLVRVITDGVTAISDLSSMIVGFFSGQAQAAVAVETLTKELEQEFQASNRLLGSIEAGVRMTLVEAQNKLAAARAIQETVQAKQAERRENELAALGYAGLLDQMKLVNDELRSIAPIGTDLEDVALTKREAYEAAQKKMVELLAQQKEMLNLIGETTDEQKEAEAVVQQLEEKIAQIEGHIENAKDGMVVFSGATNDGVSAADDLRKGIENLPQLMEDVARASESVRTSSLQTVPAFSDLRSEYGTLAKTVADVLEAQNEIALKAAQIDFAKSTEGLGDALDAFVADLELSESSVDGLAGTFDTLVAGLSHLDFADKAEGLKSIADNVLVSAGGLDKMSAESQVLYGVILNAAQAAADLAVQSGEVEVKAGQGATAAGSLTQNLSNAVGMAASLISVLGAVPAGLDGIASDVDGIISGLEKQNSLIQYQIASGGSAAAANIKLLRDEALKLARQNGATFQEMEKVNAQFDAQAQKAADLTGVNKELNLELQELTSSLTEVSGASAGVGSAITTASGATQAYEQAMREAAGTSEDFGRKRAQIMISGIDGVANAFGSFIAGGLKDFKGFAKSILSSFTSMIAQMVAQAAKSRIMISLGYAQPQAAIPGAVPAGTGPVPVGPTGLGGISSMISGIGTSFKAIGTLFKGGFGALGGFAKGIAAIAPALGVVGFAISALIGKTTLLDSGIRVTVNEMDTLVQSFEKIEKSRLFGLLKSRKTKIANADQEVADPVKDAVAEIQESVLGMASVLEIGADNFAGFSYSLELSLKDLSDEEKLRRIQAGLGDLGDAMASMVVPDDFIRNGEGAATTLQRLTSALASVNAAFDPLGFSQLEKSLGGADIASRFVDQFGSLEAMQSAAQSYFETVYTRAQQMDVLSRQAEGVFSELGVSSIPETLGEIKEIVDGFASVGDLDAVAAIMQITPAVSELIAYQDELIQQQKDLADAAASATSEMVSDIAAGMNNVYSIFGTTQQQLEYFSKQAQAGFLAAGLVMPSTAAAFVSAAKTAAANVSRIFSMVEAGQASLAQLDQARSQQLALLDLADEAQRVYDLQEEVGVSTSTQPLFFGGGGGGGGGSSTTSVGDELSDFRSNIDAAIREMSSLTSSVTQMNREQAMSVVALANQTGEVYTDTFKRALDVLKDIEPEQFRSRVDFDRARAKTQQLLLETTENVTSVKGGERPVNNNDFFNVAEANSESFAQMIRLLTNIYRAQREGAPVS